MARLVPEGVDVIASPDGAWLAVTQPDRIALHKAATLECVATFPLPQPGPTDLGFVTGPLRLLAFTRGAGVTVGQGLALSGLEPCGRREFQGHWQARAFVGDRCLLSGPDGTQQVAVLAPRILGAETIPIRQTLRFAAAAPESRFLIDGAKQFELWDAPTRHLVYRLSLQLPQAVLQGGFAHHGRLLWVAEPGGKIDLYRFSDGRRQMQFELGPEILALDGNPESSRLILAHRAHGMAEIELKMLDLVRREWHPLALPAKLSPLVAFCLVEAEEAGVALVAEDGALHISPLPKPKEQATPGAGDSSARVGPATSAPPAPRGVIPPRRSAASGGVSERVNAWRSRLRGADDLPADAPDAAAAPGPADDTAAAPGDEGPADHLAGEAEPDAPRELRTEPDATARLAPGPTGPRALGNSSRSDRWRELIPGRLAPASSPEAPENPLDLSPTILTPADDPREPSPAGGRPGAARTLSSVAGAAPSPAPASALESRNVLAAEGTTAWRATLVRWGEAALAAPETANAPPPLAGTTVGVAAQHLGLGPVATTLLGLLYAAWLLGCDREGIPVAVVARVIGDGAEWREALGRGQLGAAGLVERRRGNVRLCAAAARLLDGQLPRCPTENESRGIPPEPLAGLHLVTIEEDAAPETLGQELSRRLGRRVTLVDLRPVPPEKAGRSLDIGLVEARMYGAVPLILVADDGQGLEPRLEALASHPSPSVLAWATSAPLPPALAELPMLTLDL
jgi:hypothetical protein